MIDAGLDVPAFFTTRAGGASAAPYASLNLATHVGDDPVSVEANRSAVAQRIGAPVTVLTAEHGIRVAAVERPGEGAPTADALVATAPGVAVAAIAADCVPVLLHDDATGAVAAVHAGREGLHAGVIDAAVAAMVALRTGSVGRMSAAIGPAICGRCYEVPQELRDRVAARHPAAVATTSWGTPALDLPRAVEARLGELGVGSIGRSALCTAEEPSLFSHRRDGVTGRFAGVVLHE